LTKFGDLPGDSSFNFEHFELELSYTPPIIAKLTPMPKYMKSPYYKDYSKCPEKQG